MVFITCTFFLLFYEKIRFLLELKGVVFMGKRFSVFKLTAAAVALTAANILAAPKPLTVWIMPNGASPQETLEKRLDLFTKKTGIPTKVQVLDWGEPHYASPFRAARSTRCSPARYNLDSLFCIA